MKNTFVNRGKPIGSIIHTGKLQVKKVVTHY